MYSEIVSLVALGRATADIATIVFKLHIDNKNALEVSQLITKIVESQRATYEIQAKFHEQQEVINKLKKENDSLKKKEVDLNRYALFSGIQGGPVYALKKSQSNSEAAHYICPDCFTSNKKSFLSLTKGNGMGRLETQRWVCTSCKYIADTGYSGGMSMNAAQYYDDTSAQ